MYRIKIEEKYNGEILYIPQVCELKITGKWIKRQELVWYNILRSGETDFTLSETMAAKYGNEQDAWNIIGDYKNRYIMYQAKKVKSTTYKMID